MSRRPLVLALAFALLPCVVHAEDLLQTYELARAGDPQYSAAESNRLVVKEGRVQARALLLPQLNGSAGYTKTNEDSSGQQVFAGTPLGNNDSTSDSTNRRYGVTLDQMVFDGARISRLRSANALSEASDYNLEFAGDQLITRTSAAYFNVLVQLENLAAAEAAETALKKQFDFASKRLEVGLAPITDVHEARAQYDTARANTITAHNLVEDAYQALAEITGRPVANLKGLPEDFQPQLPEHADEDTWVKMAFDNNPALHAKQLQVKSAEQDVNTARAGHLPTLYFGGDYGKSTTDGDTTNNLNGAATAFDNESRSRSFGLTLNVPIFAGGATQSQVREALATRDIRQDELEQDRRALERSTRNAYQVVVAGVSEVEARRLAVVSAKAAYEASQVGLEVGTRTVLDVLVNQRNLFQSQQAFALARYNFLQSVLNLEQAAGTLDVEDVQRINRFLTVNVSAEVQQPTQ
ncbi:Type I secretion outer membrane protein, TolC precursor [Lysobacter dokdonensis DS-58]|uniref:Type I secretion outer membrane protein, TolC n=1 Tax=Lysobacter dokdonensis DS-58 TaxID=1300345 RepID=A0A0A2WET6_9GAMM|nr:TolC family outer membrane protein [Lysobacter dokdonensis]KGQ18268.1 Type I secretion outer membrane protein, TolC precursor [Lysobacter dokdonensis DS-58]